MLEIAAKQTALSPFKGLRVWLANNTRVTAEGLTVNIVWNESAAVTESRRGLAAAARTHIPRSKQQRRGDDKWMDGWMGLVPSAASQLKSPAACLQQSGGTRMGCAGKCLDNVLKQRAAQHTLSAKMLSVYIIQVDVAGSCGSSTAGRAAWRRWWSPLQPNTLDTL